MNLITWPTNRYIHLELLIAETLQLEVFYSFNRKGHSLRLSGW
jgi:hypothetical protein